MSLINQMLRDLESRRGTSRDRSLSGEEPKPVKGSAENRHLHWISGGGLLLIGAIWFALQLPPATKPVPQPQPEVVAKTVPAAAMTMQALTPAQGEKEPSAAAPQPTAEPVVTAVEPRPEVTPRQAVDTRRTKLLDLGILESAGSSRLALEFGQLPEYRVLQDGSSGNQIKLVFPAAGVGDGIKIPQPEGNLLKSVNLIPEQQGLLLVIGLKNAVRLQELKLPTDAFHGDRLLLDLERIPQDVASAAVVPQSHPLPKVTPAVKKVKRPVPQLSRGEQAVQAFRAGLERLQKRDRQTAEQNFSRALTLDPQLLGARLQLADLFLKAQRSTEAETLLRAGLRLQPDSPELRKALARLLLSEKQLGEAIRIMRSAPLPEVAGDLEYHALLAALLQEAGNYAAAAGQYRKLLAVRPREALWWMGLAIALEQSGASEPARKAYRQALETPGLRPDLAAYIRNRLQAL